MLSFKFLQQMSVISITIAAVWFISRIPQWSHWSFPAGSRLFHFLAKNIHLTSSVCSNLFATFSALALTEIPRPSGIQLAANEICMCLLSGLWKLCWAREWLLISTVTHSLIRKEIEAKSRQRRGRNYLCLCYYELTKESHSSQFSFLHTPVNSANLYYEDP